MCVCAAAKCFVIYYAHKARTPAHTRSQYTCQLHFRATYISTYLHHRHNTHNTKLIIK